ncbi:MAG: hypothetical protein K2H30_00020 [Clostridia bacterium]|nr:hypothetical protein [Clostridia bacterium]
MNESKRNKLVAAITVNVVILIAVLVAVVIYQIVTISVMSARRDKLAAEKAELEKKIETTQDTLEYYKSESYLLDKAFELGYIFGDD